MTGARLHPEDIEAIARRCAELLDEHRGGESMLTVAEKARQLKVSTDFVREHAAELGGIELPSDSKSRRPRRTWRFPADGPPSIGQERVPAIEPARVSARPRRADLLPIGRSS